MLRRMSFSLHPRLAAGGIDLGGIGGCRLLLKNNALFPWFLLVPEVEEGIEDLHQLEPAHYLEVMDAVRRVSTIDKVTEKSGRTGALVFVKVRHELHCNDSPQAALVEFHDIVYRDAAKPGDAPPAGKPAPQQAAWRRELQANEAVLFRYSAITFNGHRIHYDIDYCRQAEGYPGLIVHGPLQTTLLLDLCRRNDPRPVRTLDYRATHPVFHQETFSVNGQPSADGKSVELWTANAAGCYAMRGTATF